MPAPYADLMRKPLLTGRHLITLNRSGPLMLFYIPLDLTLRSGPVLQARKIQAAIRR